ncbi:MAG TPA: PQQ-binding-like beta-propeller repeat protein [Gemmataceae bacterium]|nr:PQQ-binding-like beta-propeller repeat protein [Gemmataceae bacterium]
MLHLPFGLQNKLAGLTLLALGFAMTTFGGGIAAPAEQSVFRSTQTEPGKQGMEKKLKSFAVDLYGDPLPEGAIARLGSMRFRHPGHASGLVISPDGKILASGGGMSAGVCIWDAATGKPLHRLANTPFVFALAMSSDGALLVTNGISPRVIEVATGKVIRQLDGPDVCAFAFAPDGKTVAISENVGGGSRVSLVDVATGKQIRRLESKGGKPIEKIAALWPPVSFSPDGTLLAVANADGTIRLWSALVDKEIRRFAGSGESVVALSFAPSGKVLASASYEGQIQLWELATGKLLHTLKDDQDLYAAIFSPDGKLLASGGSGGTVRLWDPQTGKEVRRWQGALLHISGLVFSPGNDVLYGATSEGIRRWHVPSGKEIEPLSGHTYFVEQLHFTADGKTILSRGGDQKVLEWDVASSQLRRILHNEPRPQPPAHWQLAAADLSADGKSLALVRWEGLDDKIEPERIIHLWDTAQSKEVWTLTGHKEPARSIKFAPDGKLLASAGADGLRLWDVAKGKEIQHLQGGAGFLAFSPHGKLLAYSGKGGTIHVWDIAGAKEVRRWTARSAALAFSSDGNLLAIAGTEDIEVWSVASGAKIAHLKGLTSIISSLAFSPSGRVLAAAGRKTTRFSPMDFTTPIQTWDVLSGQALRQIDIPLWIREMPLAFSPNGRVLASSGGDSSILLWDMTGGAKAANLDAKELDRLWSDLASDAVKAEPALWALALSPKQSLPFLQEHLKPVAPADAQQIAKLVADMDSEQFAVRQKAAAALEKLGEAAEPAVHKIMTGNLTLEVRQRLHQFIEKRGNELVHKFRAIEALEQMGTPQSLQLLETIAKNAVQPRASEAAQAALKRLAKRS